MMTSKHYDWYAYSYDVHMNRRIPSGHRETKSNLEKHTNSYRHSEIRKTSFCQKGEKIIQQIFVFPILFVLVLVPGYVSSSCKYSNILWEYKRGNFVWCTQNILKILKLWWLKSINLMPILFIFWFLLLPHDLLLHSFHPFVPEFHLQTT